jgi:hypothetical protein
MEHAGTDPRRVKIPVVEHAGTATVNLNKNFRLLSKGVIGERVERKG